MAAALLAAPAVHLTPLSVLFAACFLLLPLSLSLLFSLALSRALLLSAARAAVQLALLASLLRPLFAARSGAAVAALGAAQVALSAHEVWANKARRRYGGMAARILGAIVLATVPLTALASRFILRQAPWWEPSRYVPLLGMVLGNAISAVTLGSNHVLSVFDSQRDTVEVLLTHGASRFEACRPVAAEALRTALLPVLNQMSVVGLISIPGMMTGAILGGASVAQAAYLQVTLPLLPPLPLGSLCPR
ncbi:hypothetical protein FA09DRAFT_330036 [Tilletiopsis washingtonensis]|uniref:Uncharacterized protein n=1 Tax=Tilletiopsis washingtonensis TaxID=58919 RepID=A0A316ZA98_9BASI|nr:hypothetical protein FA09DRAFT_330036 [Tilletiopsis washingtonensis]PWN97882.1 hypothetical protein FA09DRAFT_330036 [Tilletiopsis washingtonensis]